MLPSNSKGVLPTKAIARNLKLVGARTFKCEFIGIVSQSEFEGPLLIVFKSV